MYHLAGRARMLLPLIVADTFFLWMFLAADPLERMADAGHMVGDPVASRARAYRFAADWRHGMAGNSPLYMPGFFALAAAAWFWAASRSTRRLLTEGTTVLVAALGIAWLAVPTGAVTVVEAFHREVGDRVLGIPPAWSGRAALDGMYTAATWTVFVVGSRQAIARRSIWRLAPAAVMALVLVFVRPWTVGDFSSLWIDRAAAGDVVAVWSLVAMPALATLLVAAELSPHLVQTAFKRFRTNVEK